MTKKFLLIKSLFFFNHYAQSAIFIETVVTDFSTPLKGVGILPNASPAGEQVVLNFYGSGFVEASHVVFELDKSFQPNKKFTFKLPEINVEIFNRI